MCWLLELKRACGLLISEMGNARPQKAGVFSEAEQSGALTARRPSIGLRCALCDTALLNMHLIGPTLLVFFLILIYSFHFWLHQVLAVACGIFYLPHNKWDL